MKRVQPKVALSGRTEPRAEVYKRQVEQTVNPGGCTAFTFRQPSALHTVRQLTRWLQGATGLSAAQANETALCRLLK